MPASTAWRDQATPSVTSSGDGQKLHGSRSGRDSQGDEFGARPAVEVVEIHCLVNTSIYIHRRCCNGVILVISEAARQGFCSINNTALSFKWFHNGPR